MRYDANGEAIGFLKCVKYLIVNENMCCVMVACNEIEAVERLSLDIWKIVMLHGTDDPTDYKTWDFIGVDRICKIGTMFPLECTHEGKCPSVSNSKPKNYFTDAFRKPTCRDVGCKRCTHGQSGGCSCECHGQ